MAVYAFPNLCSGVSPLRPGIVPTMTGFEAACISVSNALNSSRGIVSSWGRGHWPLIRSDEPRPQPVQESPGAPRSREGLEPQR